MTIVLGFDGSPASVAALDVAVDLAARLGGRLVAVYGVEPPGAVAGEEFREHREAIEELARETSGRITTIAADSGVEAEVLLVPELPVDALLDAADRFEAQFVVVGTHGEGPLRGAILGSVAHRLLQRSTRPVVVVPAPPG
jgi:nucleotide-binding universal stress UspA family protein